LVVEIAIPAFAGTGSADFAARNDKERRFRVPGQRIGGTGKHGMTLQLIIDK